MNTAERQYPRDALGLRPNDEPWGELIDTLFFASLGTEEAEPTRVRVVYHQDGIEKLKMVRDAVPVGGGTMMRPAWEVLPLEPKDGITRLGVEDLRKIAPAVSFPRAFVVVGLDADRQLVVQGLAYRRERTFFKPEGEEALVFLYTKKPGHLTLTLDLASRTYEDGRWARGVLLDNLLLSEKSLVRSAIQGMCASLVADVSRRSGSPTGIVFEVVRDLVRKMATMPHGGLIAMSPTSHAHLGKYQIPPDHRTILSTKIRAYADTCADSMERVFQTPSSADDVQAEIDMDIEQEDARAAQDSLDLVVAGVAQLTAVDKALLIGPNLDVICAGFGIKVEDTPPVLEAVTVDGESSGPYAIMRHGTKHWAAVSFAYRNPGGLVFAASQDGAVRCLHRPRDQEKVLLWQILMPDD